MGVFGCDELPAQAVLEKMDGINLVLSAYRSICNRVLYASVPITTGKRFYEVLEKYGVKNLEDLLAKNKDVFFAEIIKPNIECGNDFANGLAKKLGATVIAPSVFEAKKQRWGQDEYMFLWYRFLEERVKEIHLMPFPNYSNGSAKEMVRGIEMQFGFVNPIQGMEYVPSNTDKFALFGEMRKIKIYDFEGNEVKIQDANHMLCESIKDLRGKGFDTTGLEECQNKLMSIAYSVQSARFMSRAINCIKAPYEFDFNKMLGDFNSIEN